MEVGGPSPAVPQLTARGPFWEHRPEPKPSLADEIVSSSVHTFHLSLLKYLEEFLPAALLTHENTSPPQAPASLSADQRALPWVTV